MNNNLYQEVNNTIINEFEKFSETNNEFIRIFARKIFEELQLTNKDISQYQLNDIIDNDFIKQIEVIVNRKITNIKDHLLNQAFSIKDIQTTTVISNQLFNQKLDDIKNNVNRYDILIDDVFLNDILPNIASSLKVEFNSYEYDNLRILINDSISKISDNFSHQKRKSVDKIVDNELIKLNTNEKNLEINNEEIQIIITNENKFIILEIFKELKSNLDIVLDTNTSSHYKFILAKYNLELQNTNFLDDDISFNKFITISSKLFEVMFNELIEEQNIELNSVEYNNLKILIDKYGEEFRERIINNYNNYSSNKFQTQELLEESNKRSR